MNGIGHLRPAQVLTAEEFQDVANLVVGLQRAFDALCEHVVLVLTLAVEGKTPADFPGEGGEEAERAPETHRFVLTGSDGVEERFAAYSTWEECAVAFDLDSGLLPPNYRIVDLATGRIWLPGSRHEWEDAQT